MNKLKCSQQTYFLLYYDSEMGECNIR